MEFDAELLVKQVERHPQLYDPTHEEYKNKVARSESWKNVTEALVGKPYQNMTNTEKCNIIKEVQRKWKILRDAFARSLKNEHRKISKKVGARKKQYIYHNQMAFLIPIMEYMLKGENVDEDWTEETTVAAAPSTRKRSLPVKRKNDLVETQQSEKWKQDNTAAPGVECEPDIVVDMDSVPLLQSVFMKGLTNKPTTEPIAQTDPDALFFQSLLPRVKCLSETSKLDFQIKVMLLLQKYMAVNNKSNLLTTDASECQNIKLDSSESNF